MDATQKPNFVKLLLQQKALIQKAKGGSGIISDSDLSRRFRVGEKPQPIPKRGGRNGSGKP